MAIACDKLAECVAVTTFCSLYKMYLPLARPKSFQLEQNCEGIFRAQPHTIATPLNKRKDSGHPPLPLPSTTSPLASACSLPTSPKSQTNKQTSLPISNWQKPSQPKKFPNSHAPSPFSSVLPFPSINRSGGEHSYSIA